MWLRWEQDRSFGSNVQIWKLMFKESGRVVLRITQSALAEQKDNYKLRMKIKRMYDAYFTKLWINNLRLF